MRYPIIVIHLFRIDIVDTKCPDLETSGFNSARTLERLMYLIGTQKMKLRYKLDTIILYANFLLDHCSW